jgi:DNA mismatch repair ATPase MutS
MSKFIDSSTTAVLRIGEYIEQLQPDSRAGARLASKVRYFGPGDAYSDSAEPGAWAHEMQRLLDADAWSAAEPSAVEQLRRALAEIPELERPARKLRAGEVLDESELFGVKRFLYYAGAAVRAALDLLDGWGISEGCATRLDALMQAIHPQKHPTPRFHLAAELSDELESLRVGLRQKKKIERRLRRELEEALIADYGGSFDIHGGFRPSEESALDEEPRLVKTQRIWQLADPRLGAVSARIDALQEQIESIEYELRARLSRQLRGEVDWLIEVEDLLAGLDLRLAKVRLRREIDGCWADLREAAGIAIEQGREPGVERALQERGESIQAVDVELGAEALVVTGPNMGGKSVLLRLIGLCQWCAQHAMPLPAARCEFSPVSAIVYVGAEEPQNSEVAQGLSSFGREVRRLVDFWEASEADHRLWLLDEVGRGTHPDEGAEIAREIIEGLAARGDRVVAATHFPRVAALESARRLRIAGLSDPEKLARLLADDARDVQAALHAAMDYRPISVDNGTTQSSEIPRDARLVARALGLKLPDDFDAGDKSGADDEP